MKAIYKRYTKEELFEVLYKQGLEPRAAAIRLGISYEFLRKCMMQYDLSARTVAVQLANRNY